MRHGQRGLRGVTGPAGEEMQDGNVSHVGFRGKRHEGCPGELGVGDGTTSLPDGQYTGGMVRRKGGTALAQDDTERSSRSWPSLIL